MKILGLMSALLWLGAALAGGVEALCKRGDARAALAAKSTAASGLSPDVFRAATDLAAATAGLRPGVCEHLAEDVLGPAAFGASGVPARPCARNSAGRARWFVCARCESPSVLVARIHPERGPPSAA